MDPILELYFERKLSPSEIIAHGHDEGLVYSVLNKVENPANEFQAPAASALDHHLEKRYRRRPTASHHAQVPSSIQIGFCRT
jgi:hypothetical protein